MCHLTKVEIDPMELPNLVFCIAEIHKLRNEKDRLLDGLNLYN